MLTLTTQSLQAMTSDQVTALKLYELDYDPPNAPLYLAKWDVPVSYNGNVYDPIPIKDSGLKQNSDGKLEPMTLTVGNVDDSRQIQQLVEDYDIVGKRVTRIRLFQGIDDPISNTFVINGIKAQKGAVAFTLTIGFDFLNNRVPNRKVFQRFCSYRKWQGFQGTACKYSGADTSCEYSYEDCKAKGNLANFGGFPGVLNQYFYF